MARPQELFAHQIRTIRERRDWSQSVVTWRLADQGVQWDHATVSKIERGERGVSLDDALALCAVLGGAPDQLLSGALSGRRVDVTPKTTLSPHHALRWFRGRLPLNRRDEGTYYVEVDPVEWVSQMLALVDGIAGTTEDLVDAFEAILDDVPEGTVATSKRARAAELIDHLIELLGTVHANRRAHEQRTR